MWRPYKIIMAILLLMTILLSGYTFFGGYVSKWLYFSYGYTFAIFFMAILFSMVALLPYFCVSTMLTSPSRLIWTVRILEGPTSVT